MPYHYKDGDDLNLAVMYARGWNDAVKAALDLVMKRSCGECEFQHLYAEQIKMLDRSMEACDD